MLALCGTRVAALLFSCSMVNKSFSLPGPAGRWAFGGGPSKGCKVEDFEWCAGF